MRDYRVSRIGVYKNMPHYDQRNRILLNFRVLHFCGEIK